MAGAHKGIDEAKVALAEGRPALVWRRELADSLTPVLAARILMEPGRGDFLLESVEGGETRGRYSLLGLAPDLVFKAKGAQAEINARWATDPGAFSPCRKPALDALRSLSEACRCEVPEGLPPALASLVGYFSYETIGLIEKIPTPQADVLDVPDMLFVRPTVILVFDRLTDVMFCVAPVWPEAKSGQSLEEAIERIDLTVRSLAHTAPPAPERQEGIEIPEYEAQTSAEDYRAMVLAAKEYISAGDIFQVVLSQRFTTNFTLPPLELYRALRRINPSPFLFFLDFPGFALVGSSPEILVRVRDGEVTVRPIAGTRPRGATAEADRLAEESLRADPKECAEHLMLLDLGRNDVGRVATNGSVEVTASFTVERYSHVMHLVSNVVGRLDARYDALDALFAGFPAGTVSGAPKIRACEVIAELEPSTRGPYAGGVGYFAPDGSLDSCIVLRTGLVKDGVLHVQAGAGIVADSEPEYEQRECEAKAGALLAAAREAVRIVAEPGYGQ